MSTYQKCFLKQLKLELEAVQPIYVQEIAKINKIHIRVFTNFITTIRMKAFNIKLSEI